jgi:opacity protein-like surface antigen
LLLSALYVRPALAEPSKLPPELGYNYGEIETPRTAAVGGALRAFSNSVEALYTNPANMAATRIYHLGGNVQFWPQADRQTYAAAVVDSVVSRASLAGGIGVAYTRQDPDGLDRTALDVRLALAFPFSEQFLLGGTAKYNAIRENGAPGNLQLPIGATSAGLPGDSIVRGFTFSGGLTLKPADGLAFSIVGDNLTDPGHGFLPLTLGGGAGYGTDDFSVEADVVSDFTTYEKTKMRAMGGFEFLAGDNYPLRLGYRYDQGLNDHGISAGVGYTSREFAFDLSMRQMIKPACTAIFVGFKYHFEATGIGAGGGSDF